MEGGVMKPEWYARGDIGEYVLSLIEHHLINQWDEDGFMSSARQIGMSDDEIAKEIEQERLENNQ
jgi:hypothetical protein